MKTATLTGNGERVKLTNDKRNLGHGEEIKVIYQDNSKGWENTNNLIDIVITAEAEKQ